MLDLMEEEEEESSFAACMFGSLESHTEKRDDLIWGAWRWSKGAWYNVYSVSTTTNHSDSTPYLLGFADARVDRGAAATKDYCHRTGQPRGKITQIYLQGPWSTTK